MHLKSNNERSIINGTETSRFQFENDDIQGRTPASFTAKCKKVAVELWLLNDATTENGWRYEKLREHMGKFATTPILIAYVGSKIGDGHNFSEEKNPITGEVSPSFMDATAERIVGFFEKKEDIRIEEKDGKNGLLEKDIYGLGMRKS